jgi:hypothetical protein
MKQLAVITYLILLTCSSAFGSDLSNLKSDSQEVVRELLGEEENILGVDLQIAAGYKDGPFYSRWGHAFLVFINKKEKKYYNNIALNFVADMTALGSQTVVDTYVRGLTGGYQFTIEADYFYYFWEKHMVNEGRPLERIIIPLNAQIKRALFKKLREIYEDPKKLGSYKFISNNCVGAASSVLKAAGLPLEDKLVIPANAGKVFVDAGITPYPITRIESFTSNVPKIVEYLKDNKITTFAQFTDQLISELVRQFGAESTLALIEKDKNLLNAHGFRFERQYGHLFRKTMMGKSFKNPETIYTLCEDLYCAEQVLNEEQSEFGQDVFGQTALQRHQTLNAIPKSSSAYALHLSQLVEAQKKFSQTLALFTVDKTAKNETITYDIEGFEQGRLSLVTFIKNTKSGEVQEYSLRLPLDQKGNILYLNNRACVDLGDKKLTNNCGIIREQNTYKLIAY